MSDFKVNVEILKFLWNFEPQNKHDKIWGYLNINDKLYCFWGRRGTDDNGLKAIQFKREFDIYELDSLSLKKVRKGYEAQNLNKVNGEYETIDRVYPGFVPHLRSQLMLAKLAGTVRKE